MLTLVTPPADLAEQLIQSVSNHLRIVADFGASPPEEPEDADYLRTVTAAAVAMVDGPHGLISRPLLAQTWRLTIDCLPPEIILPLAPTISIDEIRYCDPSQAWRTLDATAYRLIGAQSWRPELCPAYGQSWPSTLADRGSVEIVFTSGYGDRAEDVPAPILQAIRILAAHMYSERQLVAFGTPTELPMSAKALLQPFRIFR